MAEIIRTKKRLSFELDEEMLQKIAKEFAPENIAQKFYNEITDKEPSEIEKIGEAIFKDYGKNLMQRSLQLGEEYPDRTYQILREAADTTGILTFPLIPQRFIEIAFLAVQNLVTLPVIENNAKRFIFLIEDCQIYKSITRYLGKKVANIFPCRFGCLEACKRAFDGFGIDIDDLNFDINTKTDERNYCEFVVRKGSGKWDF
jgi:hypothetical protein